jgi:muramoyltetrapeptide carboxypeptidase
VVGAFTDGKETETPFGQSEFEIIANIVKDYDYPVCYNFPSGHQVENYSLQLGVKHQLKVGPKGGILAN